MIRIGTRGSKLALWQAEYIKQHLQSEFTDIDVSINIIKTTGDKIRNKSLSSLGGKGLFVKEIEQALLSQKIDLAVHSMKDVPSELPAGLHISAVIKREDARDVLISKDSVMFYDLPPGSVIGTGSLRRKVQLQSLRNDLEIQDIRGNVDTRLSKLNKGLYDAIVLAYAGMKRLGLDDQITQIFSKDEIIPSAGQGIIGVESRINDSEINEMLYGINDIGTQISVMAERNFISMLGGDCNLPVACHCEHLDENSIKITGLIASRDGENIIRHTILGNAGDGQKISLKLAGIILDKGGKKILETF